MYCACAALQLDDAREKYKWRKDKYTKLMARHVEKNQKLQEVTKRAEDMEAQLQNMVSCVPLCHVCAYQGPFPSAVCSLMSWCLLAAQHACMDMQARAH